MPYYRGTTTINKEISMKQSTYQLTAIKDSRSVTETVTGMPLAHKWRSAFKRNGYKITKFEAVR